ncbi:MAG: FeoA family protein [Acidobacteriota bacterium]
MFREGLETTGMSPRKRITDPALTTLADLPSGACGVVARIDGGTAFRSRLVALGFAAGTELVVVQNVGRGPLIVSLLGSQVALGRGEAGKVLVAQSAHGAG